MKSKHYRWLAVLMLLMAPLALSLSLPAQVSIGIGIQIGPPPLPMYVQPPCPGPNLIWVPGYWAWGPYGYYWVPGAWMMAPEPGLLWTPGWWGRRDDDDYYWHAGYWGPRVGFYGGIDYGYGYFGYGYVGGYWDHDRFFYNRAVNRLDDREIHDVYYRRVDRREFNQRRISFNGPGGIMARPTRGQMRAEQHRRFGATPEQARQVRLAGQARAQRVSFNHGHPPVAAMSRPGPIRGFSGPAAQRRWGRFSPQGAGARPGRPARGQMPARGNSWRSFQNARPGHAPARGQAHRGWGNRPAYGAPAGHGRFTRGQPRSSGSRRYARPRAPSHSGGFGRQNGQFGSRQVNRYPAQRGYARPQRGYARPQRGYARPQRGYARPAYRGGRARGGNWHPHGRH